MKRVYKVLLLFVVLALVGCAGIRRTYTIKGEAEKVRFEYSDSVQQFNTLKK